MADPLYEVHRDGYIAVFMLGADDEPESVENVDVEVILADKSRWSATFLTLAEIGRIMARWRITGECAGGAYLQIPDLIVVRDPGVPEMVEVLDHLLVEGEPGGILIALEDDD